MQGETKKRFEREKGKDVQERKNIEKGRQKETNIKCESVLEGGSEKLKVRKRKYRKGKRKEERRGRDEVR